MFGKIKQLLAGKKSKGQTKNHSVTKCQDCGVQNGELHDLFCTKESCPFCKGQLMSCDCIQSVLVLSDEEQRALDEYIDDSIPPLADVMKRWKDALNKKGRIPFKTFPDDPIRAAYRGDVAAVTRFLEDGFPPNSGNEIGYTTLMGAVRGESLPVVRLLLSSGAQATLADKRGFTALHWAVAQPAANPAKQVACMDALLDAGVNPNTCNEDGITPLMNAAWFGCIDAVRELKLRGADPSLRDKKGRSARDLASEKRYKDIESLLT